MIDKQDSKMIEFMRFPMILGIVLIHLHFVISDGFKLSHDMSIYTGFVSFLYDGPTRIFVPLFFFISGFLFTNSMNLSVYKEKLKKRFVSLVIPYILYITIGIIVFFVAQAIVPSLISEGKKAIADYSISDYLKAYGIGHLPFVGPFWFIKNLILIVLLSPVVYLYVKYLKHWGIFILGFVWVINASFWSFIPAAGDVFFFSFGMYYRLNNMSFTKDFTKLKILSFVYIPVVFYCLVFGYGQETFIFRLGILLGILFFVNSCSYFVSKGYQINRKLSNASFMIFALHEPYLDQINKIAVKMLPIFKNDTITNLEYVFVTLVIGFIVVCTIVWINTVLFTYTPSIAKLLNGNR